MSNNKKMKNIQSQNQRLKVCFLITTVEHGQGGHFRSLSTTVQALSDTFDCVIINVGAKISPILQSDQFRLHFVSFNGIDFLSAIKKISHILNQESPDIINSFDVSSLFFGRIMSMRYHLPIVHTKCGGPNPRRYYPHVDNLIVYSSENMNFFESKRKFKHTTIRLIPNRVKYFDCILDKVDALRSRLTSGVPCFLRINRISPAYEKSMIQSIALIQKLNHDGYVCQLAIVGKLEDINVFERVHALSDDSIHFFTEDAFILDAKGLIDGADFVIGTGRGFMEAACRGKILLTPLRNASYPLLVSKDNFDEVLRTNFSERNCIQEYDEKENYQKITKVLESQVECEKLRQQSIYFFDHYFNIDNAVVGYSGFLLSAHWRRSIRIFDLILNAYLCMSSFIKAKIR